MRDQKPTTEEVYVRATKKQFHQLWIHSNADPLPRANTEWQKEENNRDPIVLRAHAQTPRAHLNSTYQLRKEYTIRPP